MMTAPVPRCRLPSLATKAILCRRSARSVDAREMITRRGRVAAAVAGLALAATGTMAEIVTQGGNDPTLGPIFVARLAGEIRPEDVEAMARAEGAFMAANVRLVLLDSPGGDLNSAMRIGRMIREVGARAIVPRGAECFSACVFVLAAGTDRIVDGTVGIHRPYFLVAPGGDVGATLLEIERIAREYLVEMNVPARLAEDMFSIDPRDMVVLDAERLREYRLVGRDIVAREEAALRMAESLGISRQAYEAFAADLNYRCTIFSGQRVALLDCIRAVATDHGLPDEVPEHFGGRQ